MKDINLLLINPWIYDFKAYDLWMKPLGLLYIASILKNEGYKIHFLDCLNRNHWSIPSDFKKSETVYGCGNYYFEEVSKPGIYAGIRRKYKQYGIPISAFVQELERIPVPAAVLVTSMMTYWYPGPFKVIELVKKIFPGIPVIFGGLYCRLCKEHAAQFSKADYIMDDDDKDLFLDILSEITGNKRVNTYKSINDYPFPLYELLDRKDCIPLILSTGCPFNCSYCASKKLYSDFNQLDPSKLFYNLINLSKGIDIRNLAFYDDALLVNFNQHLQKLLRLINESGISLNLHTPNAIHARLITPVVAKMMKESGFKTIRLGLEFTNPVLQQKTGGKVTDRDISEAINNLRRAGFLSSEIGVYIMSGVPGQNTDDINEAVNLVHRCGALSKIVEYSPIPGTALWQDFPGTDTAIAKDPLFHNNTFHIYNSTIIAVEEYQQIRQLSTMLNKSLF